MTESCLQGRIRGCRGVWDTRALSDWGGREASTARNRVGGHNNSITCIVEFTPVQQHMWCFAKGGVCSFFFIII